MIQNIENTIYFNEDKAAPIKYVLNDYQSVILAKKEKHNLDRTNQKKPKKGDIIKIYNINKFYCYAIAVEIVIVEHDYPTEKKFFIEKVVALKSDKKYTLDEVDFCLTSNKIIFIN